MPDRIVTGLTAADAHQLFSPFFNSEDRLLVAVSGGPDSMALLALLAEWRGASLVAATVDHGLRAQSRDEAEAVARYCLGLGVPHTILVWHGAKPQTGLQQAARAARYALLCDYARKHHLSALVTAHHSDDQAETLLIRMTSGSGLSGLAGMKAESQRQESASRNRTIPPVRHVRPLLAVSKQRLVQSCDDRTIPFVRDVSNDDSRFDRGRLRRLRAHLEAEGLTQERLVRLATRAAQAETALQVFAGQAFEQHPVVYADGAAKLMWRDMMALPVEIRLRLLSAALQKLSSGQHVEKLERLESLVAALDMAHAAQKTLRRSLGHWIFALRSSGEVMINPAPQRHRGWKGKTLSAQDLN